MTAPVTPETLPYVVTDDGMVTGRLKTYKVRGGPKVGIFIPDPKGPEDGWKPGQLDRCLRDLTNQSMPALRAAIKTHYGTTSFRLESDVPHAVPLADAMAQHAAMLAREEGAQA